jgi:hypothetical protein
MRRSVNNFGSTYYFLGDRRDHHVHSRLNLYGWRMSSRCITRDRQWESRPNTHNFISHAERVYGGFFYIGVSQHNLYLCCEASWHSIDWAWIKLRRILKRVSIGDSAIARRETSTRSTVAIVISTSGKPKAKTPILPRSTSTQRTETVGMTRKKQQRSRNSAIS